MAVLSRLGVQVLGLEALRPIVIVTGEIDLATAPKLAELLATVLATDPVDLVLDLADTSFLDCSAISVIIGARKQMAPRSRLVLRHPQPNVRKVLEVTQMDAVCVIEG
jgi:anti-sigma B factor antagonist